MSTGLGFVRGHYLILALQILIKISGQVFINFCASLAAVPPLEMKEKEMDCFSHNISGEMGNHSFFPFVNFIYFFKYLAYNF